MIEGSCLCGEIRFRIDKAAGPFELCHCTRCRKASGSAFVAGLGVAKKHFHWLQGQSLVRVYEAPLLESPPPYRHAFCGQCGSPVPWPDPYADWLEIPAGLLESDPGLHPDKHIFVETKSPWFTIADDLPRYDKPSLAAFRKKHPHPR